MDNLISLTNQEYLDLIIKIHDLQVGIGVCIGIICFLLIPCIFYFVLSYFTRKV